MSKFSVSNHGMLVTRHFSYKIQGEMDPQLYKGHEFITAKQMKSAFARVKTQFADFNFR